MVINYADGDSDANMDLFLYHETMKPFLKNMKIHRLQERTKILHTFSVDRNFFITCYQMLLSIQLKKKLYCVSFNPQDAKGT